MDNNYNMNFSSHKEKSQIYDFEYKGIMGYYQKLKQKYHFFRQNLNEQLFQILAVFNGFLNILGSPAYFLAEQYELGGVQLISGFAFIYFGITSFFAPNNSRYYQWAFILVANGFLLFNAYIEPMSGAQMYFIALSLIAIITAYHKKDIIIQPLIITLSIVIFYSVYFLIFSNLKISDFFATIIFSAADILGAEDWKVFIINPPLTFSLAGWVANTIAVQLLATIIAWIIVGLYRVSQGEIERLLLKSLPRIVIDEIKQNGFYQSKLMNNTTIIFIDFVAYTSKSTIISPAQTLEILNWYFLNFEAICKKHHIEKIKTIGDCFMAVCGAPTQVANSAQHALEFAKEIVNFVKANQPSDTGEQWQVRVGINCGAVITGIAGNEKYQFDVWGDAVNVASRMESFAPINGICISSAVYDELSESIECEGPIYKEVKGKGVMPVYFLTQLKGKNHEKTNI